MELEMVLNELSLRFPATDIHTARQRMEDLILTAIVATKHGVKRVIRTHSDLNHEELAPGYPIAHWRNDSKVERELRSFFRTLVTKYPFLEDIADPEIQDRFGLSECFYGKDQAIGLGVAYWLEALAISLRAEPRWCESRLQLRIIQLDDNEKWTDTFEEIIHASSSHHILEHLVWIKERLRKNAQRSVHDGTSIWKHKEDWFPSLYFSEKAGEQIQALPQGNLLLMPIMKRLDELEEFCKAWHKGPFDHNKIRSKVTNESEATMKMYSKERTFRCHDGRPRIFRWHVRLTPGAWRLYFHPLVEERKLIIGYVGPHFPTADYPK